jgi:membrane protease YdiL (CAAX protease family)
MDTASGIIVFPDTRKDFRQLLWCVGVGVAVLPLLSLLGKLLNLVPFDMPRPDFIPADWWTVDKAATRTAVLDFTALGLFVIFLRARGQRLLDLGFKTLGAWQGWLTISVVLALCLLPRPFVRSGPYPIATYTFYAAAMIAVPAAFLEEAVYRGFAMRTLAAGGYGKWAQIFISGATFGLAHISYISSDWTVVVGTLVIGSVWSWAVIKSRGSLWPVIVAHIVNDAVIMPYFFLQQTF